VHRILVHRILVDQLVAWARGGTSFVGPVGRCVLLPGAMRNGVDSCFADRWIVERCVAGDAAVAARPTTQFLEQPGDQAVAAAL
jgi:hypothetical protein